MGIEELSCHLGTIILAGSKTLTCPAVETRELESWIPDRNGRPVAKRTITRVDTRECQKRIDAGNCPRLS